MTDLGVVCELQLTSCGCTVLPHCMEDMLHWFPKQSSRQNSKNVYNRRLLKSTPQLWKPDLSQPTNQAGVFKAGNMCAKVLKNGSWDVNTVEFRAWLWGLSGCVFPWVLRTRMKAWVTSWALPDSTGWWCVPKTNCPLLSSHRSCFL